MCYMVSFVIGLKTNWHELLVLLAAHKIEIEIWEQGRKANIDGLVASLWDMKGCRICPDMTEGQHVLWLVGRLEISSLTIKSDQINHVENNRFCKGLVCPGKYVYGRDICVTRLSLD
ncbi:unnamed protein product [Candidula unifasciata]|uniref:Uncharacterized protein n=1 Tax=Candidula unifasciata TaxID=100452 RepID=A0A8S3ZNX7_9EUPU|nr:unnamed protein product [Candidula unifasciata]